jgi:hypothetical protein
MSFCPQYLVEPQHAEGYLVTLVESEKRSSSLPPEGGGIIRSKIFRALRFGAVPFRVKIKAH